MVELDVQLTKDLVPVIYHDYYVNIAMKKVESMDYLMTQLPDEREFADGLCADTSAG